MHVVHLPTHNVSKKNYFLKKLIIILQYANILHLGNQDKTKKRRDGKPSRLLIFHAYSTDIQSNSV